MRSLHLVIEKAVDPWCLPLAVKRSSIGKNGILVLVRRLLGDRNLSYVQRNASSSLLLLIASERPVVVGSALGVGRSESEGVLVDFLDVWHVQ